MVLPEATYGEKGVLFFADCGVIPNPTSSQLAEIAWLTEDSFKKLMGKPGKVALLSFSTKGSAEHPDVERVRIAYEILKKEKPNLLVDGELQGDAALVSKVAKIKAPDSAVAGKANILIFPDLDAGNIAYKLTQRLSNALALGPILQGVAKPANDLSRGCSSEDIVDIAAITILQTQQ
jgi:phosphate acetyltransferase